MEYLIALSAMKSSASEAVKLAMLSRYVGMTSRLGITGLMLGCEGEAIHYMEGPGTSLARACQLMDGDGLQQRVKVVIQGPLDERLCQSWQMAYPTAGLVRHPAFSRLLCDEGAEWPEPLRAARPLVVLRNFRARALARGRGAERALEVAG